MNLSTAFIIQLPCAVCVNRNKLVLCALLLMCGDVSPNLGPASVRYPCTVCCKSVSYSQKGIEYVLDVKDGLIPIVTSATSLYMF